MSFLVDTDVCSAHLKQQSHVCAKFLQHTGQVYLSTITVGELFTWALRGKAPPRRCETLTTFLKEVVILDLTFGVARMYGELRAKLLDEGRPPPELDLMIAATALAHDLTLVTHNTADFANIPALRLTDWVSP